MQVERIRVQAEPFSPVHAQRMALWRQRIWDAVQAARTQTEFYIAGTMQPTQDSSYLSTLGWQAFRNGQLRDAQNYFRAALHYDPYAISAWLGLSRAAKSHHLRRAYLQTAIDLQHLVSDLSRHSDF
jgi:uncharacterized protein HemY